MEFKNKPFTITERNMKCPGVNLIKYMQDLSMKPIKHCLEKLKTPK